MIATQTELRDLAQILDKFPGFKACEWNAGPTWTMLFTASSTTQATLRAVVEVLHVLVVLTEVETLPLPGRVTSELRYRISGGNAVKLTTRLAEALAKLWKWG